MKKYWNKELIITSLMSLLFINTLHAQSSRLFEKVENLLEQQPLVLTKKSFTEAEKIDFLTGINPENPNVEFEYLRPNPRIKNQVLNYKISQELEFPTIYGVKKKIAFS